MIFRIILGRIWLKLNYSVNTFLFHSVVYTLIFRNNELKPIPQFYFMKKNNNIKIHRKNISDIQLHDNNVFLKK